MKAIDASVVHTAHLSPFRLKMNLKIVVYFYKRAITSYISSIYIVIVIFNTKVIFYNDIKKANLKIKLIELIK